MVKRCWRSSPNSSSYRGKGSAPPPQRSGLNRILELALLGKRSEVLALEPIIPARLGVGVVDQ